MSFGMSDIDMARSLENRVAVSTGVASGIGRDIADELAGDGTDWITGAELLVDGGYCAAGY